MTYIRSSLRMVKVVVVKPWETLRPVLATKSVAALWPGHGV